MLHICCAPDATVPFRDLKAEGWEIAGYFYGSNIHPEEEYRRRLEAVSVLAGSENIPVKAEGYAPSEWRSSTAGLESEPERGRRCVVCFELQLSAAAKEAAARCCTHLCSSLSISPHKDVALIARLGEEICARQGLKWLDRVWRKNGGFARSIKISEELGLYRQNYCGCLYSTKSSQNVDPYGSGFFKSRCSR